MDTTEFAAKTCDGNGSCRAGSMRNCFPNRCDGMSCGSTCATDGDCQTGFFCDASKCKVKQPVGTACTAAQQCATGFCVDGVCCGTACTEPCYACNLGASAGTCTAVAAMQDPAGECPMQASTTCGRLGGCDGRGGCRMHPPGTSCAPQTCTGSIETAMSTCNGVGGCVAGANRDCGAYLCAGTSCGTTCSTAAQCLPGHECVGNTCRVKKIASLVVHDTDAARAALWSVQTNFQIGMAGSHPWGDTMWMNTYVVSMDAGLGALVGKEWLRVSAESKRYSAGPLATLTLAAPADVYMVVDDRWGTTPSWTTGWTNTGANMVVWESASRPALPFSVFRKTAVPAGALALPSIGATTAYCHFIIVD
jgi:hypothetical protein